MSKRRRQRKRQGGTASIPRRLRALGYSSYREYLASEHWADLRQRYFKHRGRKGCVVCGALPVDIHHRSYARLGREHLRDVMALCRDHHKQVHDAVAVSVAAGAQPHDALYVASRGLRNGGSLLCGKARKQERKANRHPRRDGQVRPDPITASGGATASDESVATPEVEAGSQTIASEEEAS